jgi:hypothetical protein
VLLGHDGSNTLNYVFAGLIPSKDVGFLVVTNRGDKDAEIACAEVLLALLERTAGKR